VKLYGFYLSIAYIARRRHPYIESLPTLWYYEDQAHVLGVSVGEAWTAIPRVQRRLPGVETTEVEVHMATYSLFATDHQRQFAHRQYKSSFDHNGGWDRFR